MLSASTFASSSSSAFSASPGVSTPSSQYSNDSRKNSNPLTELIENEQSYMDTLKMIDSQIAPIWMRQMTSAAPDFSELLKHAHDILTVNKRFCMKLTRIAANPQAINDLGDALMQWINELEAPYANYSRSFIPNLNQRYDILQNSAISNVLKSLSSSASYEINLESLFNAPIQQLKYYKGLYSRLLESTDPGRADHKLLVNANKQLDSIMMLSQSRMPTAPQINHHNQPGASSVPVLPLIQTNFSTSSNPTSPELTTFERQVDCSRTVDLHSGAQINYQLSIATPGSKFVMRETFVILSDDNGPSIRAHFFLTSEVLVICRELSPTQFLLMYPAVSISDIMVKSGSLDREVVGEYILCFTILGKKQITVRADSREIRNMWVGEDQNSPSSVTLVPRSLGIAVQRKVHNSAKKEKSSNIRNTDIFTYYSENGGVSPLESSDEEELPNWKNKNDTKARDTIMDIYDNHLSEYEHDEAKFPVPPLPPSKNIQSAKDSSHVQMTFIEAPTAQMSTMTISPPVPQNNEINKYNQPPLSSSSSTNTNKPLPSPQSSGMKAFDGRPSSPRAVEVQRAVIPEAMQAITQKTDDYLSSNAMANNNNNRPLMPRTSSMNKNIQQKPPMNGYGQPQSPTMNHHSPMMNPQSPMMNPQSPMMNPQSPMMRPLPSPMMNQPRPNMMGPNQYRPMPSPPPHQQQFRPGPPPPSSPMPYNNNSRPLPPSHIRPPLSPQLHQQPPGRYASSPQDQQNNDIRKIMYSSSQCDVFHWNNQSWYAAEGQCLLQIRLSNSNRTCVAVQLQNTGQLYLNAWILPTTVIRQPSPTDVNISLFMGAKKENYLIHFAHPQDANVFADILRKAHQESSQVVAREMVLPEPDEPEEPVDHVNVPQTLKPVMQCKAKLFIQNETNNWSTFGGVTLRISQQSPSMRMMIQIENDKTKLVSATVKSGNVERINSKRITFLLADEAAKTSIVYMIHLREEQTGNKIYEYLRTKNAENGW